MRSIDGCPVACATLAGVVACILVQWVIFHELGDARSAILLDIDVPSVHYAYTALSGDSMSRG